MIRITADSTCDLPRAIIEQYQIAISPLGVVKGEGLFHDGVDISTADIVEHVEAGGEITTTNAVNIADYDQFFRANLAGYDGLVHINLGMGFSSCYQNAMLAAGGLAGVCVVDSGNLSVGHGLVVVAACRAAQAGASAQEIVDLVEQLRPKVEISFVLDTLSYMKKGGRCSAVSALGANLLKLHPSIEVINGKMSVTKKYRGSMEKVVATYVNERLEGRTDIDTSRVYLVHAGNATRCSILEAARTALEQAGVFDEIVECTAGCTIFCHCGPDALGIAFARM